MAKGKGGLTRAGDSSFVSKFVKELTITTAQEKLL